MSSRIEDLAARLSVQNTKKLVFYLLIKCDYNWHGDETCHLPEWSEIQHVGSVVAYLL